MVINGGLIMPSIREERPVTYTITSEDDVHYKIYTKDSRVSEGDANIEHIHISNLFNELTIITSVLNDLGYAVLFEVD